jgi:uncharacterized coiled-coil protein SlyX
MISFRLLPLAALGLLLPFSALAQNYNAGTNSGTGGLYNVMVGPNAGRVTTGNSNSFLGTNAGYSNTTGFNNSFLGASAGFYNTTGYSNSFVGENAGQKNTSGSDNSFFGTKAGFSNTTGYQNSFVGYYAGYSNTTGVRNSFVGYYAGGSNTAGEENSFVGYSAGSSNTTGYGNNFLGYAAGKSNTIGSCNNFVGTIAGWSNTTGSFNSSLGYLAGYSNTTGSYNSFLGTYADASSGNLSNAAAIGSFAYVSTSNSLVLGAINGINGATASTNVGIGTSAPSYLLHVNGDAAKPGSGSWTVASDKRLKKNISTFSEGLNVLQKVKPVWFQYNGEAGMPTEKKYVGIIAQEMQKIAPYTVGEFTYSDSTGKQTQYLHYDDNALTYILVNSVKEQQGQIETLKQENTQQQTQLAQKDARIEALETRLAKLEQLMLNLPNAVTAEEDDAARLWQNEPNPTEGTTIIRYRIPQLAGQAQIDIISANGQHLKSYPITQRGEGQLTVPATLLPSGTYLYRLLIDGKGVDAKKLIMRK